MKQDEVKKVVEGIGKRLYSQYGALRVILYGSFASGVPHGDSDIDLLIIKETDAPFIERLVQVRRLLRDIRNGMPLSPIVLTPSEIAARQKMGDQFIEHILESGIVL